MDVADCKRKSLRSSTPTRGVRKRALQEPIEEDIDMEEAVEGEDED